MVGLGGDELSSQLEADAAVGWGKLVQQSADVSWGIKTSSDESDDAHFGFR